MNSFCCGCILLQVVLSNGDLAVNTSSSRDEEYECVAYFEQRNVTLARYRMNSLHGDGRKPFSYIACVHTNLGYQLIMAINVMVSASRDWGGGKDIRVKAHHGHPNY